MSAVLSGTPHEEINSEDLCPTHDCIAPEAQPETKIVTIKEIKMILIRIASILSHISRIGRPYLAIPLSSFIPRVIFRHIFQSSVLQGRIHCKRHMDGVLRGQSFLMKAYT